MVYHCMLGAMTGAYVGYEFILMKLESQVLTVSVYIEE